MDMQKKHASDLFSIAELSLFDSFGYLSASSPIGLVITDTDGVIIGFNKAVQDLLGVRIEDYRNTNVCDWYENPEDRQRMLDLIAASRTVRNFEVELKHQNGSKRTVLANIDLIEREGEHVLLTSVYDITQYIEQQRSRIQADENFRDLFSDAPVGITVTDIKGNLVVNNNAISELLGYSANELKDISIRDFYLIPDDRKQLLELTRHLGSVRDFETKFRHKNGSTVSVLLNTDIIEFNGQPNMLLTSIRDITYLKHAEDELIKERDFSNAILNIAATLTVVINHTGVITRFNRACEQASGYSADEIIGTNLADTHFFEPNITSENIKKLLSDDYPGVYETVLVSKNGNRRFITWTFAAILDREGHADYIIATGIDITERKKAEDDLKVANEKLAAWVKALEERTEEMNQLNEMGEQLQSCQTIEEACAISIQYIRRICPNSSGALYLIKDSRNLADAAGEWGESHTQHVFDPMACWAIRRGRQHQVDARHPGLLCGHISGPESGQYLCVPLMVNGVVIGILHLNHVGAANPVLANETNALYTEHKTQLVTIIAEHIALALSNLKLKETLRQQSIRDALTGLYNRRYMEETMERELSRAERERLSVGVMMFDIDHFKNFNDLEGHDAGDALLRELGALLNKSIRGSDIVCRYGGEEFLVVLPGASKESTRQRAEELRQAVKDMLVYHLDKPLAKCTISIGVAAYPENETNVERLLKAADNALYRAKHEGRDRVVAAE